jgi:hypothetical protein
VQATLVMLLISNMVIMLVFRVNNRRRERNHLLILDVWTDDDTPKQAVSLKACNSFH